MCHKQNIQSIARSIFFVYVLVPQQLRVFNISIRRFDAYDSNGCRIFPPSISFWKNFLCNPLDFIISKLSITIYKSWYTIDAKYRICQKKRFLKSVSLRSTSSILTLCVYRRSRWYGWRQSIYGTAVLLLLGRVSDVICSESWLATSYESPFALSIYSHSKPTSMAGITSQLRQDKPPTLDPAT